MMSLFDASDMSGIARVYNNDKNDKTIHENFFPLITRAVLDWMAGGLSDDEECISRCVVISIKSDNLR